MKLKEVFLEWIVVTRWKPCPDVHRGGFQFIPKVSFGNRGIQPLVFQLIGFFIVLLLIFQVCSFASVNSFQDVSPNHWAKPSIDKLIQLKVIDVSSDGLFQGDKKMTRYELAVWLDRLNQAILLDAAIREKLVREFDAEAAEIDREIKELRILTK
jgi:hypothetical protein